MYFKMAIERLSVPEQRCVFIGSKRNTQGDPTAKCRKSKCDRGVHHIKKSMHTDCRLFVALIICFSTFTEVKIWKTEVNLDRQFPLS